MDIEALYNYNDKMINKLADKYYIDEGILKMFFLSFIKGDYLAYFMDKNPDFVYTNTLIVCVGFDTDFYLRFNNINGEVYCEYVGEYVKDDRFMYRVLQNFGKCGSFKDNMFDINVLGKPLEYFFSLRD